MAEREQIQKPAPSRSDTEPVAETPEATESAERLKAEMDGLLDEIDEVLETNAEEFVNSYIQKGGQ